MKLVACREKRIHFGAFTVLFLRIVPGFRCKMGCGMNPVEIDLLLCPFLSRNCSGKPSWPHRIRDHELKAVGEKELGLEKCKTRKKKEEWKEGGGSLVSSFVPPERRGADGPTDTQTDWLALDPIALSLQCQAG